MILSGMSGLGRKRRRQLLRVSVNAEIPISWLLSFHNTLAISTERLCTGWMSLDMKSHRSLGFMWVGRPKFHLPQLTSLKQYGNQAEPRMTYSSLALVAVVPKGGAENATDIAANTSEEPEGSWEQTKIVSEFWDSELRKWRKEVLLEGPGPCLTEVTPEGKQEAARQRDIEEMQRYYQEKHSSGIHQKRGSWRY